MLRQVVPTGPLGGVRVGVTAGRGGRRLVDAMRRAGAVVAWGPTFDTVAATPARLRAETTEVLERGPGWIGVTTERGGRVWADGAGPLGPALRDLLAGAGVVARNRAAARVVTELGGRAEVTAASGRSAEVARLLLERAPAGGPVAVQVDGGGSRTLVGHLREAGAEVLVIRPHRWEPPADVGPAARLVRQIAAGDLDIVTFTSPPAVDGLFEVAAGLGRRGLAPRLVL
ncbi:MAG TPA: uroporphyrinogen-III synthase, partial [Acidimicrobiales bacterium]|nr:uroporphyrinogen-III synthase [Acidimicrobiales bacterium]